MKRLLLLVIPIFIYADSLKELIDFAKTKNDLVVSKTLSEISKAKELEARESSYYPTLDVGAYYQRSDDRSPMQPGDTYSGFAKVGVDIYDGGKKSSLVNQAKSELKSATYEKGDMQKSVVLNIVQDFFTIKSLNDTLDAKNEAKKYLQAQLERVEKFYEADVATKDEVDRIQASYDTNIYEMESIKFQILSLKKSLELSVGKSVEDLDDSKFMIPSESGYELAENLKALIAQKEAVVSSARAIDSSYYPQIRVEDSYSLYEYDRTDASHPKGAENQNKLMLTFNMRLYDNGVMDKSKEAVMINSEALNSQISYKTKEQKMLFELANARIQTSQIKIQSATSAQKAANSAFKVIEEKYNVGIVDYVVYLDALTSKTVADALYKTSLNDLEVAYAMYYYYEGKNVEEYIQ
ncbi:Outer membrane protein TolC [Epsilonproteobacteria bacterium SCGC AD-308-O04]|nr:Outer membrane protein TolC [Epsilonproteobacteria bacterium SCGC AD-308-O04]